MRASAHEGKTLKYVDIVPDDYNPEVSYPLIIMLHGFGANMRDLAGLAPVINPQGYVYACPNAPIPFDLGGGYAGYGWMSPRGMATVEEVRNAESMLSGFFDEMFEKFRVEPGKALLLGFSQGGGMTYRCGLGRPETFAGLVALSASLPDQKELEGRLPPQRSQPIFVAHGRSDPLVSAESAQATRRFLEGAGYQPEYREYNMAHEISMDVLNDLIPWINRVLPPMQSKQQATA